MTYGENGDPHAECRERIAELEAEVERLRAEVAEQKNAWERQAIAYQEVSRDCRAAEAEVVRLRAELTDANRMCVEYRKALLRADEEELL